MDANPSVERGAFGKSRVGLIIAARLIRVAQDRLFESIVTLSGALQVRLQVAPFDALRRRSG